MSVIQFLVKTGCGAHLSSLSSGYAGSFPLVLRLKCGANHSSAFNGEVKNCWKCAAATVLYIDGLVLSFATTLISCFTQRKYCEGCYIVGEELELYEVSACYEEAVVEKYLFTCSML
jgi:hypothetical protein